MIWRSKIVLYNAQEHDTFGKDSEVAIGLSLGRHAVVYVARLFNNEASFQQFQNVYSFIDRHRGYNRAFLIDAAFSVESRLNLEKSDSNRRAFFESASESQVIELIIEQVVGGFSKGTSMIPGALSKISDLEIIRKELLAHGYQFTNDPKNIRDDYGTQIRQFAIEKMKKLEGRAFIFSESHPLSFQASIHDGVARGVIVTRTIVDTRIVIHQLLTNSMEYYIETTSPEVNKNKKSYGYLLREKLTKSPVRVVTNDLHLSEAFWKAQRELSRKMRDGFE